MPTWKPHEAQKVTSAAQMYHRVIAVVEPFLGLQSETFVLRQIVHIRITPEELTEEHIPNLAVWIENSSRLILRRERARQLYESILALGK